MSDPLASWHRSDDEILTVADIVGEPQPWRSSLPEPHAQRLTALIRERGRRVDAQDALRRLVAAVEAHRDQVPTRNRRDADRTLWGVLETLDLEGGA